jgi:hypothetical protein
MRIIQETIKSLDVARIGASENLAESSDEGTGGFSQVKYRLAVMDPSALQMMLEDIGDLDPHTELWSDSSTKTLFAKATAADHQTIKRMVDDLDGTGRQFQIIRLRKKNAEVVAAGIYNLMVGEEEEKDDSNRRPWWYGYGRGDDEDNDKPNKGFRVYADPETNSLWLWANESEMEAVYGFLKQLGETPTHDNTTGPIVRTLDSLDVADSTRLLEQIQRAWSALGFITLRLSVPMAPRPNTWSANRAQRTCLRPERALPQK